MKIKRLITILSIVISPILAAGQNDGFIYGKITTMDNDTYEGPIRWGKEEVFWTDMFNASKEENENIEYLSRDERDYLEDLQREKYGGWNNRGWNFVNVSWDNDYDFIHQFSCQFGEIRKLETRRGDDVLVTLQNGTKVLVEGSGYNDIGSDIKIIDTDFGEVSLDWGRIDKVEFMSMPNKAETFGGSLYGTVYGEQGKFTGFVQWDHDERLTTDKLDGDSEDGRMSIRFGKIKSIERDGYSRSTVILQSGRELSLDDTNDVDSGNRGIIVTIEGVGRVDIPWKEFDKVEFSSIPKSAPSYNDFKNQRKLTGTVLVTNGDKHSGDLVYDLDEAFDYEVLDGEIDKTEFEITFRNIKSIEPRNNHSSTVILKNGDKLVLYDSQDVNEHNTGILVFTNGQQVYVPWEQVEKVTFNR